MNPKPLITTLCVFSSFILLMTSCQKKQDDTDSQSELATTPEKKDVVAEDPKIKAAIELILQEENLALIGVKDGKISFKNKHNQLQLTLTPEEIKEEKYKNLAAIGPQHTTQPLQNENGSDWGKTPNWIPRYPGAAIPYGSMHAPLKDGSIWGNITITHSDSEDLIVEFLKREFLEQGFKLTANVKRKGSSYVVFKRLKEGEEKRHVTCTLSESGGKTRVSIQYSYGMP